MHRRLLSAAASGALLLGLAACGDPDDGPVTTPPPDLGIEAPSDGGGDADPSDGGGETGEPTADAPDIPPPNPADFAGMDENTPEGAEQAFKYYIAMMHWSRQTGDLAELQELYSSNCSYCTELSSDIDQNASNGMLWRDIETAELGVDTFDSTNYDIEVGYVYLAREHFPAGSDEIEPEQEWTGVAGMNWESGTWMIGELTLEETGDAA